MHFGVRLLDRGNREVRLSTDGLRLYANITPRSSSRRRRAAL
nr:hypothetical protein [Mesorhizobium sp.]